MSTSQLRIRLRELEAERSAAHELLPENRLYLSDLEDEIAATTAFYIGAAVTDIATLRGELSGRNQG